MGLPMLVCRYGNRDGYVSRGKCMVDLIMRKGMVQYEGFPHKAGKFLVKYGQRPLHNSVTVFEWVVEVLSTQSGIRCEFTFENKTMAVQKVSELVAVLGD